MTEIEHGALDWDKSLNPILAGLQDATNDTGWVPLTLVNGFQNQTDQQTTVARKIGNITFLKLAVTNLKNNTICAYLPDPFKAGAVSQFLVRTNGGNPFGVSIDINRGILIESSVTKTSLNTTDYLNGLLIWVA